MGLFEDCTGATVNYEGSAEFEAQLGGAEALQAAYLDSNVPAQSIEQQAIHDGMRPLTQSALQLARDKLIPLNEVYRVRLE